MKDISDKSRTWTAAALVLVCLAVIGCATAYTLRVLHLMRSDTDQYLLENAKNAVLTVTSRVEEDFYNLNLAAETCANLSNRENRLTHLRNLAGGQTLDKLALAEPDGTLYLTNGNSFSMAGNSIVEQALQGSEVLAISQEFSLDDQTQYLVYAVPIVGHDNSILGALIWRDTQRFVTRWFPQNQSDRITIVESDGSIILSEQWGENVFDLLSRTVPERDCSLEQLRSDLSEGRQGIFYYHNTVEEAAITYFPLPFGNWFLLLRTPLESMNRSLSQAMLLGILLCFLLGAAFLLFLYFFRRAQQRHTQLLEQLAFSDPVTGGDNALRFSMRAEKLLEEAAPASYVLASADIQAFGLVNRIFGESAGDRVLSHLCRSFQDRLQFGELVARDTQDQFLLLLHADLPAALEARLEEMARHVNRFNEHTPTPYYLHLTIGLCLVNDPTHPLSDLLDQANLARKRARQHSTDKLSTCAWYRPEDQEQRLREQNICNQMERALENGDFKIYLQPKFSLAGRRVVGAEALVRWQDGEQAFFRPDSFIPYFERNGFITRLDRYMFEQSCIQLRQWLDAGLEPVPISVNLSRANLAAGTLAGYQAIRERYGIPPSLLEFELTETMMGENPAFFSEVVEAMHQMGFQCSIDDFGSGYSTLYMLQQVQVDTIKLDKSLFDGLRAQPECPRTAIVVESVLQLARRLGLKTVAEGISTQEQLEFLERYPCDMVQGYYFSHPLPAEEFCRRFLRPAGAPPEAESP